MFAMDIVPPNGDEHDDWSGAKTRPLARGCWRVPGGIMCKMAFFHLSGKSDLVGTSFVKNGNFIFLWLRYDQVLYLS